MYGDVALSERARQGADTLQMCIMPLTMEVQAGYCSSSEYLHITNIAVRCTATNATDAFHAHRGRG